MAFQQGPQTIYTVGAAGALGANVLVKLDGTGAVIANTATPADLPVGVTYTSGAAGATIPVCGINYGIMAILTDASAITIGSIVYAGAAGIVTANAGGRMIGIAKTANNSAAVVIDVIPVACILTYAALTASTAVSIFLSSGSQFSLGSVASRTLYLLDTTFTTMGCPVQCLNLNFQALALAIENISADLADVRSKMQTTKVLG